MLSTRSDFVKTSVLVQKLPISYHHDSITLALLSNFVTSSEQNRGSNSFQREHKLHVRTVETDLAKLVYSLQLPQARGRALHFE